MVGVVVADVNVAVVVVFAVVCHRLACIRPNKKLTELITALLINEFLSFQGELDSAESEVRYILAHDVYSKDAEYVLGRILELKGSLKEARHYFHEVLKKDYMHSGARESLQRLNKKSIK